MVLKEKFNLVFILILSSTFFSSCLSLSSVQTGRTLGKENFEIALSGSTGKYSQISALFNEGDFDYLPVFAIRGQYGISKKIDIGITVDQGSFIGPNIKYQFIGDNKSLFASSIGLESGFNFGAFVFGNFTYYFTIP